jgi:transcriptional regulator with XRE-family HTH domain
MDVVRLGSALRALRRKRGWTQAEVARRARVSQAAVSRAERGEALSLTGRSLKAIAEALGARYDPRIVWQGEGLDRLLDAAHAGLVDRVVELLRANDWQVIPEATFNIYGERGSIDILAFHPASGSLLIVEVKSVVPDMQGLLASLDRKDRLARQIAGMHTWSPRSISRLIVLPEDRTARRRVTEHAATLDAAYPDRTIAVRRWLRDPEGRISGLVFVSGAKRAATRHRLRMRRAA